MSKRHKHRYDYELEHRWAHIELQRQFVILILILLMYSDSIKQINNRIIYKTTKEDISPYPGGKVLFNIESEIQDSQAFMEGNYGSDERLENIHSIYNELKLNNSKEIVEEIKDVKDEPQIVYSNIKVYNTSTAQCSLTDSMEDCEMQVVSKVPIVLSNTNIQVLVEALTKFPEQVLEIKDIDKKVVIKECRLIPGTNKLFIKGMIQENIEYESGECTKKDSIDGIIKNVVFDIPFKGSAKVSFFTKPEDLKYSSDYEIEFLNSARIGADFNKQSSIQDEIINERIYAELDSVEILETDIQEEITQMTNNLINAHTFENMRKNIVVNLGLSLLQKQKIFISNSVTNNTKDNKDLSEIV